MQVKRFGVSLEEDVLQALDELVVKHSFPNRSQAIRHLVQTTLVTDKVDENKIVAGAIVIVYDHHKRELNNKLMHVQHDYHDLILSTQHVHLEHDLCLETIAVKGKAFMLIKLADKIVGTKGIKHGKLVITNL
ncbi:MAG: nickel-responsive transcriptional regulator NikR [Bacteroidetes bacterium HGW-Bacteroidetes-21]|jgi:CopG family nickel-responsive transcriptional regulator|nr:MAG: nickel-responsive transcriptional regulator NikR [Bacteroidetes bacterium HGW-Bacteroidetes-21]